ncbi:MAG: DUF2225 domain-containing protein [Spirochaetes bacterium]|nr:DUF2225 domain-containing protein [Spirochaetota bacterium]
MDQEMDQENDKKPLVTFYLKNTITCPVCGMEFKREEMMTGRGRLITKGITKELRRYYEPSKVYGKVNPLLYPVTVCPRCYFGVLHEDFDKIKPQNVANAKAASEKRLAVINRIFGTLDFRQTRELKHGAASYILAIDCYDYFDKWASPTMKKAICSIRAAWLFNDLEMENPLDDYGNMQNHFYKKAHDFYKVVLIKQERGEESFDGIKHMGPDTDFNYGYDGILYLVGVLAMRNSYLEKDKLKVIEDFTNAKKIVSKMFGLGKASKEKPSLLLDMARELYDELSEKIEEIKVTMAGQETSSPQ